MKYLSAIDFISVKPKIMFYSQPRYKSALGGLFSILASLVVINITGYLTYVCVKRDDMLLIYNEVDAGIPTKNLFDEPVLYGLLNNRAYFWPDIERYVTILASYREWHPSERKLKVVSPRIDYDCRYKIGDYWPKFKDDPKFSKENFNFEKIICVDPTDPVLKDKKIYGKSGDSVGFGYSYLNVYISKCINNTAINKTDCYPKEKIDKEMQDLFVGLTTIDYTIDNYNFTQVNQPYVRQEVIPLSANLYRRINIRYFAVDYTTDFGYLFEENVLESFNKQVAYSENVDLKTNPTIPGNFAYFMYSNNEIRQRHRRTFMKLQTLFANIGGAVKGILLIMTIMQNYISDSLYYVTLSNDILSFEGLNEVHKKKKEIGSKIKIGTYDKEHNKKDIALNIKNNYIENPMDSKIPVKNNRGAPYSDKSDTPIMPGDMRENPIKLLGDQEPNSNKNMNTNFARNTNTQKYLNDKPTHLEPVTVNTRRKDFTELKFPKFSFTLREYMSVMFKRGNRYDVFKVVKKYIDKKTSIDHIIKKLHEVDINRFITLEADHLKWMKMIPGPDINYLYNNTMTSKLQMLWSQNEFNHEISASEKSKIQKLLRDKSAHDNFELKLLDLTEKFD